MTDLILVRLHPGEQTDPDTFTAALQGLQITAFDLTVADPGQPVQIGTASGLAAPPVIVGGTLTGGTVDLSSTQIIQHWLLYIDGIDPKIQLESAATAVIEVSASAGHPEYPTADSFDVQLVITRNGVPIADAVVEYNAAVVQVATPSPDQTAYFGTSSHETVTVPTAPGATYATIPPAPPAGAQPPALLLSSDGTPPSFGDLKKAIDGVLADDPGGTDLVTYTLAHGQLSAAQCQQIGAEIIWNRGFSQAPDEPSDYGLLYTSDPASALGVKAQDEDGARQQFEGKVSAYHATNDALAVRLAGYVFAASAAVLAEQTSAQATSAGFPFPLITGTDPVIDTEVELKNVPAGSFAVPAAYFYALATALSSQITPDQRYHLAVFAPEDKNLQQFTAAAAAKVIGSAEGFVTPGVSAPAINANQAARRLSSLGAISGSLPAVVADADVTELVNDWLGYSDVTATIDAAFWSAEVGASATTAHQADYLDLVLQVVSGELPGSSAFAAFLSAVAGPAAGDRQRQPAGSHARSGLAGVLPGQSRAAAAVHRPRQHGRADRGVRQAPAEVLHHTERPGQPVPAEPGPAGRARQARLRRPGRVRPELRGRGRRSLRLRNRLGHHGAGRGRGRHPARRRRRAGLAHPGAEHHRGPVPDDGLRRDSHTGPQRAAVLADGGALRARLHRRGGRAGPDP